MSIPPLGKASPTGTTCRGDEDLADLKQWSIDDVHAFLAEIRKEMHDYKVHTYFEMCVFSLFLLSR